MHHSKAIKDGSTEARQFFRRVVVAAVAVCLFTGVLVNQMVKLQVRDHEHYSTLSQQNRVRLQPVPPTRGLIYDRNGVLLAENRPSYRLTVTPEQVRDMPALLAALGEVVSLDEAEISRFQQQLQRARRFHEVPLKLRLTEEEVARLSVHRHRFPGVEVRAQLTRHYPHGEHMAHVLGYVGRISEQELRRIDTANYAGSTHIGKSGVERAYENLLHGRVGYEQVETNALGRVLRVLERHPPEPGVDLYLTLDSRLQRVAEAALGDQRGSVVAMDVHTGDILAMVSHPGYDPNLFVGGISHQQFQALQSAGSQPLFNRAIRGQYPPGSTIKPFVALAGLHHGETNETRRVQCSGQFSIPGDDRVYRGRWHSNDGLLALRESIAESCNIYFYDLAYRMGIDDMSGFLAGFGFGQLSGLDLNGERRGVLPSRDWKRGALGEGWYHGETLHTGIGQGYFSVTPLQLAVATAVMANRGQAVQPRLLARTGDDAEPLEAPPAVPDPEERVVVSDARHWDAVIEGMEMTVHGRFGTARRIDDGLDYRIAGKTGTAQVSARMRDVDHEDRPYHHRDHGLFVAFAPAEAPRIAVSVVVEHGGGGGRSAAPVARQVLDAYLKGPVEAEVEVAAEVSEHGGD
ncbi:penicillin-binding protein 2 [Alkalilimnicola ehrlichii MLHE-1]|uniref:Peptidoglycan D,D-transpeptidase MrdA n=1 Tax=Alkalilimnicola ehrlichii (strain ATCC BAA-1101 / DSM 17681 / MLHE-1) TaxID=187272 RepID=Q0ACB0_ALKEH|nr:penicillin-binding protein 2 [Alkalilimnicola ehrlichii]ABI55527.1 peptidoglycan glycosyltransferase [Alkalilimnicola ehrlichii MLHE-1]